MYHSNKAECQKDREPVAIECRNAERCQRLRRALETAGFAVYGSCAGDKPPGAGRLHLEVPRTSREIEVLQALCDYDSQAQVARALKMNERSVERHLAHIRAKLEVQSTPQAIALAFRRGLLA